MYSKFLTSTLLPYLSTLFTKSIYRLGLRAEELHRTVLRGLSARGNPTGAKSTSTRRRGPDGGGVLQLRDRARLDASRPQPQLGRGPGPGGWRDARQRSGGVHNAAVFRDVGSVRAVLEHRSAGPRSASLFATLTGEWATAYSWPTRGPLFRVG